MKDELERRKAALEHDENPLDDLPIAVLILVDGGLVRTNDGWTSLTGLDWRSSIGDQWLLGIHEDDRAAALQLINPEHGEQIRIGELRVRSADAEVGEVWVHARTRFVGPEDPTACVVTLTEIDARKAHELRLLHLATHDAATGLVNREHFVAELEGESARAAADTHLAVLFVDLDRFKDINDRNGHAFGDIVLAAIAQRLEASVRPADTVARLGGDEFAILLPGLERHADAAHLADRIITTLSAPLYFGDRAVSVGASIGIAMSAPERDARTLVELADHAMYRSKVAGGSRWTFAEVATSSTDTIREPAEPVSLAGPPGTEQIDEMVHNCQVILAATESEVLTVVGRLEAEHDAGAADAVDAVRGLFEQLWSVVADASSPRRGAG